MYFFIFYRLDLSNMFCTNLAIKNLLVCRICDLSFQSGMSPMISRLKFPAKLKHNYLI